MTKTHGTEKEFRSCTLVMKVNLNASTCGRTTFFNLDPCRTHLACEVDGLHIIVICPCTEQHE